MADANSQKLTDAVTEAKVVANLGPPFDDKKKKMLNFPNFLTLLRLLLTAPICWTIISHKLTVGFVLFVAATIMDYLDGRVARRTGRDSGFGAVFDLFTDGVLFLGVILSLWNTG